MFATQPRSYNDVRPMLPLRVAQRSPL